MQVGPDGQFINLARLNFTKYADMPNVSNCCSIMSPKKILY